MIYRLNTKYAKQILHTLFKNTKFSKCKLRKILTIHFLLDIIVFSEFQIMSGVFLLKQRENFTIKWYAFIGLSS